jgi:hypothetical protein
MQGFLHYPITLSKLLMFNLQDFAAAWFLRVAYD